MNQRKQRRLLPRFEKWTIARKLHFSFGLTVLLIAMIAFASAWWIFRVERSLSYALRVEGPLEASLQEMVMNADQMVEEVTKYLADGKLADKKQATAAAERFEQSSISFQSLSTQANLKEPAQKLASLFKELESSGNDLISLADRRSKSLVSLRSAGANMKALLNQDAGDGKTAKVQQAAFDIITGIDDMSAGVEGYMAAPSAAIKEQIQAAEASFLRGLDAYSKSSQSVSQKNTLNKLGEDFRGYDALADQVLEETDNIQAKLDDYEELAQKVASFLDNELQPLIFSETVRAIQNSEDVVESAATWLFVMVAVGAGVGLISVWAITKAVVEPLSILMEGADKIGAGNLGHRIDLEEGDEFAELGGAFNKMTENLASSQEGLERKTEELQQEIIEHRRTEDALRESQERYRRLNESLEETVREKVAELQQAQSLAAIGQVVAVVAHEVRNPLQNIFFALDEMREGAKNDPQKLEIVERIDYGINIINGIVGELLQYSRPVRLCLAPSRLAEIIQRAIDVLNSKLSNVTIQVELENEEQELTVDAEKMTRVIVNLISNASEAMPKGGQITIYSRTTEHGITLGVSDTGPGIAPEVLQKMREPFFTTKTQGTGLGIPICEKIVEAHHGKLSIRSKLDEGTTVEIELPE